MRVTLPVDPHFKTASEVATLKFLAQYTSIPVPRVIAYNASSQNDLQFEWILMTRLPGVPLRNLWPSMSWNQKIDVVKKLSEYINELQRPHFSRAGNLYLVDQSHPNPSWKLPSNRQAEGFIPLENFVGFVIGPIVTLPFFFENRVKLPSDRGPFFHSSKMVMSLLNLQILSAVDRKDVLAASIHDGDTEYDLDDLEDLDGAIEASRILLSLVDNFFDDINNEEFVLRHNDLSTNNILIDASTSQITGIVDWECVSLQPLWEAMRAPQLLDGPEINTVAFRRNFGADIPADPMTSPPLILDTLEKDNLEYTDFHEELQGNLEKMLLRRVFEKGRPSDSSAEKLQRIFVNKIRQVDSEVTWRRARYWAERVRDGKDPEPERDEVDELYFWPED
ncbi:phosphotransferase enzyme family-domain-containing protein [Gymnopilus junonius]|uniref:Phosphotransferase enzyme family-domain-containing protein n=1 Tax=Gymnopilus junonius TaxID=109634 RepID=A0A9P5NQX9_GYMJU|nr:phosphotransferase enzyme family-domain-containing protein [Gymnopilus junonius]